MVIKHYRYNPYEVFESGWEEELRARQENAEREMRRLAVVRQQAFQRQHTRLRREEFRRNVFRRIEMNRAAAHRAGLQYEYDETLALAHTNVANDTTNVQTAAAADERVEKETDSTIAQYYQQYESMQADVEATQAWLDQLHCSVTAEIEQCHLRFREAQVELHDLQYRIDTLFERYEQWVMFIASIPSREQQQPYMQILEICEQQLIALRTRLRNVNVAISEIFPRIRSGNLRRLHICTLKKCILERRLVLEMKQEEEVEQRLNRQ